MRHPNIYMIWPEFNEDLTITPLLRQVEEAEKFLERAPTGDMQNSLIHGQFANAPLHINRNAEAVQNYEKAFEIGIPPGASTCGLASYNLACAYLCVGQNENDRTTSLKF